MVFFLNKNRVSWSHPAKFMPLALLVLSVLVSVASLLAATFLQERMELLANIKLDKAHEETSTTVLGPTGGSTLPAGRSDGLKDEWRAIAVDHQIKWWIEGARGEVTATGEEVGLGFGRSDSYGKVELFFIIMRTTTDKNGDC